MKQLIISVLLIVLYVTNLFGQTKIRPEEYAVYASVLRVIYKDNRRTYSNQSHFVILNVTKVDRELDLDSSSKFKALFRDFKRNNLTSGLLEARLPSGAYSKTYYLVAPKEIEELFKKGQAEFDRRSEVEKLRGVILLSAGSQWMPFYEKYPEASGYYSLSKVGFNGSYALVQVERSSNLTGFTRAYVLKKVKGKWKIVNLFSLSEWIT